MHWLNGAETVSTANLTWKKKYQLSVLLLIKIIEHVFSAEKKNCLN